MRIMDERPNILILSIDSLPYSYSEDIQKELQDLFGGISYKNAMTTASHTSSAMPTLAAGSYVDDLPKHGLPPAGEPTPIAERLAEQGYDCSLWTDNYLFGAEYNYDRGFRAGNRGKPSTKKKIANRINSSPLSRFSDTIEWVYFNVVKNALASGGKDESLYSPASKLNHQAGKWLTNEASSPYFCWVHYMDTHHPYEPPADYLSARGINQSRSEVGKLSRDLVKANREGYSESDLELVRNAYQASVDYLHDELIHFVKSLVEESQFNPDKDILVFTADHGEYLRSGDVQTTGHYPSAYWEDIVHIPLLISAPGLPTSEIADQASLIGLVPTVEKLANGESCTPDDLKTNLCKFVSKSNSKYYSGFRTESGLKAFGWSSGNGDWKTISKVTEEGEVILQTKPEEEEFDTDMIDVPNDVRELIRDHGPFIRDSTSTNRNVNKEHLRNLGYLE